MKTENYIRKDKIILVLFFTYGVSLKSWVETGLIDREVQIYKSMAEKGVHVYFITYGDKEDYNYQDRLGEITVLPFYAFSKRPKFASMRFLHSFLLPFVLRKTIKQADILKTNQMWGSWILLVSKFLLRKKTIIRCGYEKYRFALSSGDPFFYRVFVWLSSWAAYKLSNEIVLTSEKDKEFVIKTFSLPPQRINVFSNYIDIDMFKKINGEQYNSRLLFVGRLNDQKNIFSLLDAIKQSPYELDIIGDGKLRQKIEAYIRRHAINANLLGSLPNRNLPPIINRYPVYILPSFYEGNPKTLLEAMACGTAVIGSNVEGIKEIIVNNENGLLCGTESDSIREMINKLMQDKELRNTLGRNARKFIMENCSLERIVDKEFNLYMQLVSN